ncbi:MAG: DUF3341 domain-containing protein [Terriglobales bacterium]
MSYGDTPTGLYGLMAEFTGPQPLVHAAEHAYQAGYRKLDAYSPFPIEEAMEAIGAHHTRMPLIVLLGAITGGLSGYLLQYWINVIDYPLNIGGRPLLSWPAFIIVTFELTILGGAIAAVVGMLLANGLPLPYHPVFNVPRFSQVTQDGFFLCIEAADPNFDRQATEAFLHSLHPTAVSEVPN